MSPARLFRRLALAEAVTWALLLLGMVLKYGTETTELGVRVFGMLHGVVFVAYAVVALLVAVDQRWGAGRTLLALACAVPPFATVPFDLWLERQHPLQESWRLRAAEPGISESGISESGISESGNLADRVVAWVVGSPLRGVAAGVVAVAALTGLALLVGPPTS